MTQNRATSVVHKSGSKHSRKYRISNNTFGYLIILTAFALSVFIRLPDFKHTTGLQNLEATYHALLTVHALSTQPLSDSKLLPIVTQANKYDKFIPWGAALPMSNGNFVYTSFPPLGFIAPFVFFKILHLEPTIKGLIAFNCLLGLASAFLLYHLIVRLLLINGAKQAQAIFCSAIGVGCLIFSREGLASFGIVYWSHSLQQLFLIAQLIALLNVLGKSIDKTPLGVRIGFLSFISFLTAYTEWSGLIGNAIICLLIASRWLSLPSRARRILIIAIAGSTAAAIILIMTHLFLALGINEAFTSLLARFGDRNVRTAGASFSYLIQGYNVSYGALIPVVLAMLVWSSYFYPIQQKVDEQHRTTSSFIILAACAPLLENILLLQHSIEFSFDRLKFAVPLAIVVSSLLARMTMQGNRLLATIFVGLIIIAFSQNFKTYYAHNLFYADWREHDNVNRILKDKVAATVDLSCSILATNFDVRGYSNLLFGRGIYEYSSPEKLRTKMIELNACAGIWLEQRRLYPNIPSFLQATIYRPDQPLVVIQGNSRP
ncbi:hypothetical protein KTQ42_08280|uniref:hypothetical protein n=1 Tax=Noviherbaspirillum sp. L7-7A TaxID=2850560 RepID=UPI001C2BAA8B|nr:hypothetical protein [Noviherbaspirillum sp. L7-7A]MBV0879298.1 hypothetical protein [Noviherbaspirillum sp. L7-7A]